MPIPSSLWRDKICAATGISYVSKRAGPALQGGEEAPDPLAPRQNGWIMIQATEVELVHPEVCLYFQW